MPDAGFAPWELQDDVANNVDAVEDGSEQGDEERRAPASPQAVFAEEGPAERCGLRGGNRCRRRQRYFVIQMASSCDKSSNRVSIIR